MKCAAASKHLNTFSFHEGRQKSIAFLSPKHMLSSFQKTGRLLSRINPNIYDVFSSIWRCLSYRLPLNSCWVSVSLRMNVALGHSSDAGAKLRVNICFIGASAKYHVLDCTAPNRITLFVPHTECHTLVAVRSKFVVRSAWGTADAEIKVPLRAVKNPSELSTCDSHSLT